MKSTTTSTMSYSTSTQVNNWLFTDDTISGIRENIHNLTKKQIIETNPLSEPNILTIQEELQLINYYETKIIEISKVLNLPDKVTATGIIYLKRFFLKNSVMKVSPKLAMICCLYLACKTEDNHLEMEHYSNIVKVSVEDITGLEITILESLNFNLIVYHPYRPLHGYLLDIFDQKDRFPTKLTFDQLWEQSKKWVEKSLFTDLPLLHHPYIIALACLELSYENYKQYIEHKSQELSIDLDSKKYQSIVSEIDKIKSKLLQVPDKIELDVVKKIDRKLIFLNNPDKEKKDKEKKSKKDSTKKPTKKKLKSKVTSPATIFNPVAVNLVSTVENNQNNNNNDVVMKE